MRAITWSALQPYEEFLTWNSAKRIYKLLLFLVLLLRFISFCNLFPQMLQTIALHHKPIATSWWPKYPIRALHQDIHARVKIKSRKPASDFLPGTDRISPKWLGTSETSISIYTFKFRTWHEWKGLTRGTNKQSGQAFINVISWKDIWCFYWSHCRTWHWWTSVSTYHTKLVLYFNGFQLT